MDPSKRQRFEALFHEFVTAYASTPAGQKHGEGYAPARKDARAGYDAVVRAASRGEDVTDLVIRRLLPHGDADFERVRKQTDAEAWPKVAEALLAFVRTCNEEPADLRAACGKLVARPDMAPFHAGLVSPILNALRPKDFILVHAHSRAAMNYFAGTDLSLSLRDYPALNETAEALISEASDVLAGPAKDRSVSTRDMLDMFAYWLVTERDYPLREGGFWKIEPGPGAAHWGECKDEGFIGVDCEDLGDLAGISREDFDWRCRKVLSGRSGLSRDVLLTAWQLSRIRQGDHVVANRGVSEVLGLGLVTGPYTFEPGAALPHRLPVEWIDARARKVSRPRWTRTLLEIDLPTYEDLRGTPPLDGAGTAAVHVRRPLYGDYSVTQLAADLSRDEGEVARWARTARRKGQILLAGPPGAGKTFAAEHLARHLVSGGDGFVELVQLHPSWTYEAFVHGEVPGRFADFCARARGRGPCVMVLDEIDRADLGRVLGELLYLLEDRTRSITLAVGGRLEIPDNVLLVGTMNTGRRAEERAELSLLRRFAHVTLSTDVASLKRFHDRRATGFDPRRLCAVLDGARARVGLAPFMRHDLGDEGVLEDLWLSEIEPYLEVALRDTPGEIETLRWKTIEKELGR